MPKKKGGKGGEPAIGSALIRDRFKGRRFVDEGTNERALMHTSDLNDGYDWNRITGTSITEQGNLDDFLATAELAGTEFIAEKMNVSLIAMEEQKNEAILTAEQRASKIRAQDANQKLLRIPRRPKWTKEMTAEELQERERYNFLEWRRGLAQLQEVDDILLTPFERNIDFWRQLWRVIERSDVVVQIVDGRNPLLFRCADLESYVHEVHPKKRNLLLVNKADLLSEHQRAQWAEYLTEKGINFAFFSAFLETEKNEKQDREKSAADVQAQAKQAEEDSYASLVDEIAIDSRRAERLEAPNRKNKNVFALLQGFDSDSEEKPGESAAPQELEEGEEEEDEEEEEEEAEEEAEDAKEEAKTDGAQFAGEETTSADGAKKESEGSSSLDGTSAAAAVPSEDGASAAASSASPAEEGKDVFVHEHARLYTCETLCDLLKSLAEDRVDKTRLPTIGLVGYPNVGKSSTINALVKEKKVSVSATPGKTKHFQTIMMGDMILCDCPGLVFPNFANTKAELVCNGVLPIDNLHDTIPPCTYVAQTIPRDILEKTYGINLIKPADDDPNPNRPPTAWEVLNSFSYGRGFMNARGLPDVQRGGRIVLKDYVAGKLLFCVSPPGYKQLMSKAPGVTGDQVLAFHEARSMDASRLAGPKHAPRYANEVDVEFFKQQTVRAISTGAKGRANFTRPPDPYETVEKGGKKHFKKDKREKIRRKFGVSTSLT